MTSAKVLVVGAGSIGARHARLLAAQGADVAFSDPRVVSLAGARVHAGGLDDVEGFDAIIVATPSALHREHALAALTSGARVLVEKPLATSTEGLDDLVVAGGDRLAVACNQRLYPPNERVVEVVRSGRVGRLIAVRLWTGHYLPDWRPTTDYRSSYSARRELGGGILFDAIHEIDLLLWLLGDGFEVLGSAVDRLSDLAIDVEDTVRALLRHTSGALCSLELDAVSRRYRRGMELIGTEGTLRLDRARSVVEVENGDGIETVAITEPGTVSYERQAERLLEWVATGRPMPVEGTVGAAAVRLAERIREASGV